ncbi:MAG: hypothetical protein DRI37_02140 [Chloroflexi bacterium]|nr:MAG: hypothetical protein DRI37_02140 [Chloroflexota bacterium]
MAILSTRLELVDEVWVEIGAISFIGQQVNPSVEMEIVNADATPVGYIPEAMSCKQDEELVRSAPVNGAWYCRALGSIPTSFRFTEI